MKRIFTFAVITALLTGSANAGLVVDFYTGATAGFGTSILYLPNSISTSNIKKSAQSYGLVLGADIPVVRAEVEYDYLNSKDARLNAGMFNAYLKLFPIAIATPYIGAGIGSVFGGTIGKGSDSQDAKTSTAYQGMIGLQFSLPATPLFVDVEGRVFYADSIYEFPIINKDMGFLQYDLRAKLRYVF